MPPAPRLAVMGPRGVLDLCLPPAGEGVEGVPATSGHEAADALARLAPDVVVVLDPDAGATEALHDAPPEAVPVAFVTRGRAAGGPPVDLSAYARVVAAGQDGAAWRLHPLPVADRLYRPVRPPAARPRALFVGEDTEAREDFLVDLKHEFDLVHAVGGLGVEDLERLLARTDVGVALAEPAGGPTAPHMPFVHLAAGQLLIADEVPARHGLRPGIDFVEVRAGWQAQHVLAELRGVPDAFRSMRVTGRRSAERFRASRVWPRLAADVLADVRAFGR